MSLGFSITSFSFPLSLSPGTLLGPETAVVLQQVTYSVAEGYGLGLHARAPASRPPPHSERGEHQRRGRHRGQPNQHLPQAAQLLLLLHNRIQYFIYFYMANLSTNRITRHALSVPDPRARLWTSCPRKRAWPGVKAGRLRRLGAWLARLALPQMNEGAR